MRVDVATILDPVGDQSESGVDVVQHAYAGVVASPSLDPRQTGIPRYRHSCPQRRLLAHQSAPCGNALSQPQAT